MRALMGPSRNSITYLTTTEATSAQSSGPAVMWEDLPGRPIPTFYATYWGQECDDPNPLDWDFLKRTYKRGRCNLTGVEYRRAGGNLSIDWSLYRGMWCRIFGIAHAVPGPLWLDGRSCWIPRFARLASIEVLGDRIPWDEHIRGGVQ